MAKKQFETDEQILKALKTGVKYYRMYGPSHNPKRTEKIVVNCFPSEMKIEFKYTDNLDSPNTHNDYIRDMQNAAGKAVFTSLKMAREWDEEFKPIELDEEY